MRENNALRAKIEEISKNLESNAEMIKWLNR